MNTEQQAAINAEAEKHAKGALPRPIDDRMNPLWEAFIRDLKIMRLIDYKAGATFALSLIPEPVDLNCMVCGKEFKGEEPIMCCNGSDCGCMGMPSEPVVCSAKCYYELPGIKSQYAPTADMQADAEREYPYTNPKTPQNNAVVDRERAAYLKGCMRQSAEPDFIQAVTAERDSFCLSVNSQAWNTEMRTAAESLLVMYDQMKQRLTPLPYKS